MVEVTRYISTRWPSRDLHCTFTLRDDVPWIPKMRQASGTSFMGVYLPGVNHARNPPKDPEENVDAEIFFEALVKSI
jgi:hypothetical protein